MNVINGASLLTQLVLWLVIAIALAVAFSYFTRPRTRAAYPGGQGRYLTALLIQAAGFMIPIPIVLVLLLGRPIPPGLDVILAVLGGLLVVTALRAAPITGPMLKDLHRARLEAAMQRLGPKS